MGQIDTGGILLTLVNDRVVVVEAKAGITVDKEMTRKFHEVIEQRMPGDYSLVIDRKNNYRMMRFEVYGVANSRDRLKGIAVVVHSPTAGKLVEIEAPLARKPFAQFTAIDEALAWARGLHQD